MAGVGRKRTGRFGGADRESGRRRFAARMNARGNSQSRALAIHPPVRTALTRAVGSDFAKVLSKPPAEELERCSELLYTVLHIIACDNRVSGGVTIFRMAR